MEGENNNELKTNVNSDCSSSSSSSSISRTEWETNLEEENGRDSAKISVSSNHASSALSYSSSGELFQFKPQLQTNSFPKPKDGAKPLYKNGKTYAPIEVWHNSEESVSESSDSITRFSDVTHESFVVPNRLPTQSPPVQVMERNESFDPTRIPASIFARSEAPVDWSMASTGSLFSIQIGNDSFSKDRALRMSGAMYRSGEIPVSGELLKSGKLYLSCKSVEQKRSVAKGVESNQKMEKSKDISKEAKTIVDEPSSDVSEAGIDIRSGTNLSGSTDSCNVNHHSDGNKIRIQAFVSPIKKKPACPLCRCVYAGCMYSCCKWPGCCYKWSGCSCKWFSWPSCSIDFFSCCCKWPNCCNCKWPRCRIKCPTWSSCCCKLSNCCDCKWPRCRFKCPTWSSCCCCKCHVLNFICSCCYTCNHETKRPRSLSFYALMEGR